MLSAVFSSHPVLAIVFLAIGTLGVIGSMPIFWPVPSTFLAGTAAAAGIGIVNSVGNLGGYVGPNIPVWMKGYSADPSISLYVIAGVLLIGALIAFIAIPGNSAHPERSVLDGACGGPQGTVQSGFEEQMCRKGREGHYSISN